MRAKKEMQMLEEAYEEILERKYPAKAPKGDSFKKDTGEPSRVDSRKSTTDNYVRTHKNPTTTHAKKFGKREEEEHSEDAEEAKPGYHFKKGSNRQYKNGHTTDGEPHGGSRLNSDPTYKNPNESQEQEDLSKMYKFGNVQFQHLGKDRNGAEAFRVYKDGSYVLYATMFGPRKTVTLYADPEADGQQTASPEEGKALKEMDKTQVPGGIEQVAAKLGATK